MKGLGSRGRRRLSALSVLRSEEPRSHGGPEDRLFDCLMVCSSLAVRDTRGFLPRGRARQRRPLSEARRLNTPCRNAPTPPQLTGALLARTGPLRSELVPGLSSPALEALAMTPNLGASNQQAVEPSRCSKADAPLSRFLLLPPLTLFSAATRPAQIWTIAVVQFIRLFHVPRPVSHLTICAHINDLAFRGLISAHLIWPRLLYLEHHTQLRSVCLSLLR